MISQLRRRDYDIVSPNEDEPQADKAYGSFADGRSVGALQSSRVQSYAPVQEQKARNPMWQAARIDGALRA
jgi:hypothetical protein